MFTAESLNQTEVDFQPVTLYLLFVVFVLKVSLHFAVVFLFLINHLLETSMKMSLVLNQKNHEFENVVMFR